MKLKSMPSLKQKTRLQAQFAPQLVANIQLLTLPSERLLELLLQEVAINPLLELDKEEENTEFLEEIAEPIDESQVTDFPDWPYTKSKSTSTNSALTTLAETTPPLQSYLEWQAQLSHFTEQELAIALMMIDSIDEQGFLTIDFLQIAQTLNMTHSDALNTIAKVHTAILNFEPIGVAARNAKEYLLCQLKQSVPLHAHYSLACIIVEHALTELSQHDIKAIKKITQANNKDIIAAIHLILSLPPYPAADYHYQSIEPIAEPDLFLVYQQDHWQVRLNPHFNCRLTIDASYARIIQQQNQSHGQLKTQLKQAQWLQTGLLHRQNSLLAVAECIFKMQSAFLASGETGLRPLTLKDISQKVELHTSTVSRVIQNKTIQTPRGLYELSYFLTNAASEDTLTTARACQRVIQDLIKQEPKAAPYSDEMIRQKLTSHGLNLSRRVISKYRQQLGIAAAHLRKKKT